MLSACGGSLETELGGGGSPLRVFFRAPTLICPNHDFRKKIKGKSNIGDLKF